MAAPRATAQFMVGAAVRAGLWRVAVGQLRHFAVAVDLREVLVFALLGWGFSLLLCHWFPFVPNVGNSSQ